MSSSHPVYELYFDSEDPQALDKVVAVSQTLLDALSDNVALSADLKVRPSPFRPLPILTRVAQTSQIASYELHQMQAEGIFHILTNLTSTTQNLSFSSSLAGGIQLSHLWWSSAIAGECFLLNPR